MEMTDKYIAYIHLLNQRDQVMVMLAIMAVAIVTAWFVVRWLPADWRPWVRRLWLIGGMGLYIVTVVILALLKVEV